MLLIERSGFPIKEGCQTMGGLLFLSFCPQKGGIWFIKRKNRSKTLKKEMGEEEGNHDNLPKKLRFGKLYEKQRIKSVNIFD